MLCYPYVVQHMTKTVTEIEKIVNSKQNLQWMGTGKKKDKQYFDNLFRWANEDQQKNVKDRKYFDWVIYNTLSGEGINIYGNTDLGEIPQMKEVLGVVQIKEVGYTKKEKGIK